MGQLTQVQDATLTLPFRTTLALSSPVAMGRNQTGSGLIPGPWVFSSNMLSMTPAPPSPTGPSQNALHYPWRLTLALSHTPCSAQLRSPSNLKFSQRRKVVGLLKDKTLKLLDRKLGMVFRMSNAQLMP